MKKLLSIAFALVLFISPSLSLAYTPDPQKWEYVASDPSGNNLYIYKNDISKSIWRGFDYYEFRAFALALMPNGSGSYFIDGIVHTPEYGDAVRHISCWDFIGSPTKENMVSDDWIQYNQVVYYATNDPWFKAEHDYVMKRARELGLY